MIQITRPADHERVGQSVWQLNGTIGKATVNLVGPIIKLKVHQGVKLQNKILLKGGKHHIKIIMHYCMLKKCVSVHGTVRCFEDCSYASLTTRIELQTFVQNRMI